VVIERAEILHKTNHLCSNTNDKTYINRMNTTTEKRSVFTGHYAIRSTKPSEYSVNGSESTHLRWHVTTLGTTQPLVSTNYCIYGKQSAADVPQWSPVSLQHCFSTSLPFRFTTMLTPLKHEQIISADFQKNSFLS